ncbi:MAG: hypothetical protein MJ016_02835 [Victivallaceae bacterium]|nr:hypothetical protein [Victivallaceae bacterium]
MNVRKDNPDFRRRYAEIKRRAAWSFDAVAAGILATLALAAFAVDCTRCALCAPAPGGFAGWILVTIGFVPRLLCDVAAAVAGKNAEGFLSAPWHLAAADAVWIFFLWCWVRLAARKRPPDFLRRAGHIALVLLVWCIFQLLVFAAASVRHTENPVPDAPICAENAK